MILWPAVAAAQRGTIRGTVTGQEGGTSVPLSGVTVCWRDAYSSWGRCAATDGAGGYAFDLPALPPRPEGSGRYFVYTLNATDLGYTNEVYDNILCPFLCHELWSAGTLIVLTSGLVFTANLSLDRGGVISGRVTDAGTSAPLAGVTVFLSMLDTSDPPFAMPMAARAQTDAGGLYTFKGLPAGRYYAFTCTWGWGWDCLSHQGYVDEHYDNIPCGRECKDENGLGTPIDVALGVTAGDRNFALDWGGRVTGTITDAVTAAPVAGACVRVFRLVGERIIDAGEGCVDAAGVYDVGGLPGGTYFAYASAPSSGHMPELYDNVPCIEDECRAFLPVATPIAVTLGATTAGRNFALSPGGTLRGVVRDAVTSAPLPSVRVSLVSRVNGTAWEVAEAQTDLTGGYTVPGLPGGTYYAFTSHPNYLNEIHDDIPCPDGPCSVSLLATTGTPIAVAAGAVTSNIDFGLRTDLPPGAVQGPGATVDSYIVTLAWGAPLEGGLPTGYLVEAGLAPGTPLITLPTSAQRFVASVGPGRYYVRVRAVNAHGAGPASEEILVVVAANGMDGAPPSAAPRLTTAWMSGPRLTMSWQGYVVTGAPTAYVAEAGSASGVTDIGSVTVHQSAVTYQPAPNGFYFVRVRAVNAYGSSPPSNEVMLNVGNVPAPPHAPVALQSTVVGSTVTLSWQAPPLGAVATTHLVRAGSAPGLSNLAQVDTGSTATTAVFQGVPAGTYYVRVHGVNRLGAGRASNEVRVVVP